MAFETRTNGRSPSLEELDAERGGDQFAYIRIYTPSQNVKRISNPQIPAAKKSTRPHARNSKAPTGESNGRTMEYRDDLVEGRVEGFDANKML